MIHFNESLKKMKEANVTPTQRMELPLMEAQGYVLAEDIVADHHSPAKPTSAMDGYAIRHQDLCLGRLKISSINPAGSEVSDAVREGVCIKTFTGSLMPEGADTLIPIENVCVEGDEIVITQEVPFGFSVRAIGENYAKGELLIPQGTRLSFCEIGVLASLNIAKVWVYEKPTVAILSTGSELLLLGEEQTNSAQIRSSNNYILEAMVKAYHGIPLQLGAISDDKESILNALEMALQKSDIVVTTGGVSVGDFDFVKDVIGALGCEILFKGVRIKPGQHIMVAQKGKQFIIGLPGFAYSSTVTALLYLLPLIEKMQAGRGGLRQIKARLKEPFTKRAKKAEFTACNLSEVEGEYYVDFKGKKVGTSAILTNMLGDVALMVTSEEESSKEAGEEVMVLLLDSYTA
jgi:molybdopterin molybdotransferase